MRVLEPQTERRERAVALSSTARERISIRHAIAAASCATMLVGVAPEFEVGAATSASEPAMWYEVGGRQ